MRKIILVLMLLIVHCTFLIEQCYSQVWSSFGGSGFNGGVSSIVFFNNELIVAGSFTLAGGINVNRIAKWNGSNWSQLGSGMNDNIYALAVYNNELIAGGKFTTAGGVSSVKIAKWNGSNWSSLGSGMTGSGISVSVNALTVFNNELIAGGSFDYAGGNSAVNIAKWNGVNWQPLGSGLYHSAVPTIDGVRCLTVYNNELVAGGAFDVAGGFGANYIAKWDGTNWSPLGSGIEGAASAPPWIYSLMVYNNELYAGGSFWFAGGISSHLIAKWNGLNWSPLGNGIGPHTNAGKSVSVMSVFNNELIIGGVFDTAGNMGIPNITKWNGTTFSSLGSGTNGGVASLVIYNNELILGGLFTLAGGIDVNNIAKWGSGFSVSGFVRYSDNNQPVTSGKVKAFKFDKNTWNVIYLDSANIQSDGSYTLANIPQDSVDIGVFPNSTPPNDWVVTYYPSTIYWENASIIYPTGNLTNINISALRLTATSNSNSVSGRITGIADNPAANLKDAFIYAKNGNTFVRCGVSDVGGMYHLLSLPAGSIKIIATRLGFSRDSVTVNVTASGNTDSINFQLHRFTVGINQISSEVPSEFKLFQNYPNPFNPDTKIKYQLAKKNQFVLLIVYDVTGKEIVKLVNRSQDAGTYEVFFSAFALPSGIYFYKLSTGNYTETKKMLLVK